jgi:hypothetical protein
MSADEFLSSKFPDSYDELSSNNLPIYYKSFRCAEHKKDKNDNIYDDIFSNRVHLLPVCATDRGIIRHYF